jgi:cell division transport system ATP-binding protein
LLDIRRVFQTRIGEKGKNRDMIEFKNVKKTYENGTEALNGVDLRIEDGEFVFIVGSSGAGKSTLTKLLTREEKISEGSLTVDEFDLVKMPERKVPYYRRSIGVVFQDFRLLPDKTVYENVAFAMEVVGEPRKVIKRRVPTILHLMGLEDKASSFPDQLSGGEQQRVALARALANNPKTIIADEPTGNIDPKKSLEIMNMLLKIHKKNKTVIVVTHEKYLVDHFRQRVITIENGKVVGDRVGGMFGDAQV